MNCLSSKKANRSKQGSKIPCNICQHDVICPVLIPCKHLFCFSCITDWLRQHNDCPAGCAGKVTARDLKAIGSTATNLIQQKGDPNAKLEEKKKKVNADKTGTITEILENILGCHLMIIEVLQSRIPAYDRFLEAKQGNKNIKTSKVQGDSILDELAETKSIFEKISMKEAIEKFITETIERRENMLSTTASKSDGRFSNQCLTCVSKGEKVVKNTKDQQENESECLDSSSGTINKATKKVQSKIEHLQKTTDPPFFKKKPDLLSTTEPTTSSHRSQNGSSDNMSNLFIKTANLQKANKIEEKKGTDSNAHYDLRREKDKQVISKNLNMLSVDDISFRVRGDLYKEEEVNMAGSVLDSLDRCGIIQGTYLKPTEKRLPKKLGLVNNDKRVSFFSSSNKSNYLQSRSQTPLCNARKYMDNSVNNITKGLESKGYWSLNAKEDDEKLEDPEDERNEVLEKRNIFSKNLEDVVPILENDSMRLNQTNSDFKNNPLLEFKKSFLSIEVGLTPEQERNIIKKLLNPVNGDVKGKYQSGNQGKLNQVKFIICAKWWRNWSDYVLFESNGEDNDCEVNYQRKRPGKIINRDLITLESLSNMKRSTLMELKENILEHHDYEAVSKFIFKYLKKWYGVDFEIIRFLKNDPFSPNQLYLDLYPEKSILIKQKQMSKSLTPLKKRFASNRSYEEGGRILSNPVNLTTFTQYDTISDLRIQTPSGGDSLSFLGKQPISNSSEKAFKKYKTQSDNCSIQ